MYVEKLFVSIDALDECNDAENLVAACETLPLNTVLLFTGRQCTTHMIRRRFPSWIYQFMEIQNDDIVGVISARIMKGFNIEGLKQIGLI